MWTSKFFQSHKSQVFCSSLMYAKSSFGDHDDLKQCFCAVSGASLHIPKWVWIFTLWLPPRSFSGIHLLDSHNLRWWSIHRLYWKPTSISGMDITLIGHSARFYHVSIFWTLQLNKLDVVNCLCWMLLISLTHVIVSSSRICTPPCWRFEPAKLCWKACTQFDDHQRDGLNEASCRLFTVLIALDRCLRVPL